MGNRAVITTNKNLGMEIGVYLHWNGGRDSVEAFLAYCDLKGYRKPEEDSYGYAMLINVISNYFGSGLSCDVNVCIRLDCDNWDNGVYIIKNWRIIDRMYFKGEEQDEWNFLSMINEIDAKQPEHMQLTREERKRINEVYEDVKKYRKPIIKRDAKGRFMKKD